ncbi:Cytoadherence-linked asexual protein [Babesia duncani]|uniref:Cytoadherence-linked asexual protein n=1 Tax=Babesia duncani TaxID=323732 RepID=A0AAD9PNC0_9APIC|nr:Cytoadherence-linked asexual protein [Babesia duncani]
MTPFALVMHLIIVFALVVYNGNTHATRFSSGTGATHFGILQRLKAGANAIKHAKKAVDSAEEALLPNIGISDVLDAPNKVKRAVGSATKKFNNNILGREVPYEQLSDGDAASINEEGLFNNPQDEETADIPENVSLEANMAQLERMVGIGGFHRAFLDSVTPEARNILSRSANSSYVRSYHDISQRVFIMLRNSFRLMNSFNDDGYEKMDLIDFQDGTDGDSENIGRTRRVSVAESLLQINAKAPTNGQTPNVKTINLQTRVKSSHPGQMKGNKILWWDKNPKIAQALLEKIIRLLGGDSKTHDVTKRLENMAMALGFAFVTGKAATANKRMVPLPITMATDMFWACGENPFLLGHIATAMLGYADFKAYFSTSPTRPYFSFLELIKSKSGQDFDNMCGIKRGSKYKKASNGMIKLKSKRSRTNAPIEPNARFLCDILEVLLDSIKLYMDKAGSLLIRYGVAYESSVGAVTNGKRMQVVLCSDPTDAAVVVRCNFQTSILNKSSSYKGLSESEAQILKAELKDAFDLFKIMSDVALDDGEMAQTWLKMLWDPRRYSAIFETALSYDKRMFNGELPNSWLASYQKYEKSKTKKEMKTSEKAPAKVNYPYTRLYQYMEAVGAKTWVNGNMNTVEGMYNFPPSVVISSPLNEKLKSMYKRNSTGLAHLFLYYILTLKSPGEEFSKNITSFGTGSLLTNIAESSNILIPRSVKRGLKFLLKGGLRKKFRKQKSKATLLQILPTELLKRALTSITFVTHSLANFQINQSAERWGKGLMTGTEREKKSFVKGGYAKRLDDIIRKWSDEGYSKSIADKLRQGDELSEADLKTADFHTIRHSESLKWDKHLNNEILKGYDEFLGLASIKVLDAKSSLLYAIVKDSRENLEKNLEDTIFYGRVVQAAKFNNKFKRFLKRVESAGKILLTSSSREVEHAVWFGVKFDYDKIVTIVEELVEVGKKLGTEELYTLEEAFTDIIDDLASIISNAESRDPPGVIENYGMPSISPLYTKMSVEEQKSEFQHSMCQHHCGAIWKALLGFTMSTLRSPASIEAFENMLSKDKSLNDMNKPEYVNNLRFVLKGDSMLHLYDSMLPKKMKDELRSIRYGRGFFFANIVKMASKLLEKMGFRYTSNLFRVQAPYFGNFINDWADARKKSKKQAIFAALTMGTMATYSVLQCAEIAQHARDIGSGPVEECWYLLKPPRQFCTVLPVTKIAKTTFQIGIQDAFSVTVLAAIGPYLFLPMGIISTWSILKHQFKIIHRLNLAASSVFKKMWRKVTSGKVAHKLANWFKNSKKHRKKIESEGRLAAQNAKKNGKATTDPSQFTVSDELLANEDIFSYTSF